MILWFFVVVFIKGVNFKLGFLVNKYKICLLIVIFFCMIMILEIY